MGEVKDTEKRAMGIAIEYERKAGRKPQIVAGTGCGYDIESRTQNGREVRHIEVKGRGKKNAPHVFLTDVEHALAKTDERYWVYLVLGSERDFHLFAVVGKIAAENAEEEIKWRLRRGSWLSPFRAST